MSEQQQMDKNGEKRMEKGRRGRLFTHAPLPQHCSGAAGGGDMNGDACVDHPWSRPLFMRGVQRKRSGRLTELGDLNVSLYPDRVDSGQRFHFVIKVKELVSVHEYPEPLVLAVDLNLEGTKRRKTRAAG